MSESDQQQTETHITSTLPFDVADLTRGIRVKPAQFARMCNVSRQAVSNWIKQGKITLFTDGTLDPAKAAQMVVKNTDPSRLRAKVFRASNDELADLRKNVRTLAASLAAAKEDADFHEGASHELIEQWKALRQHLQDERDDLLKLSSNEVIAGIVSWMDEISSGDIGTEISIQTHVQTSRLSTSVIECPQRTGAPLSNEEGDGGAL